MNNDLGNIKHISGEYTFSYTSNYFLTVDVPFPYTVTSNQSVHVLTQITLNSYKTAKFNTVLAEYNRSKNVIAISLGSRNGEFEKSETLKLNIEILAFIMPK